MRAIMSDRARLQRMLDFEAALARAEAAMGVVTATGAVVIGEACDASRYDIDALVAGQVPSGNIAAGVVGALTRAVAARDPAAASFVHWGATSQDVIDTALMLELRAAIDALIADLDLAIKGFAALAGRHRRTLSVARTLLQQALPMPFGLKLAGYAAALARSRERLIRLRREALVLQFGGAAGTLAVLGEHGFAVAERLAALLDLVLPDAPWHSHRDRLAEIAACFGILAGTCGKIARDVTLMMQTEVGEAFEPAAPGRGTSSTLPHKRNPVGAAAALSAATIAPNLVATLIAAQVQEHERARRRLAHRLDDVSGAGAGHVGRARRRGRDRPGPRGRRRAAARQPRDDRRSDHGRGGVVRARREDRPHRGACAGAGAEPAGLPGEAAVQGGAAQGPADQDVPERHGDREAVHPADLSGLGPDLHRPAGGVEPVADAAPARRPPRAARRCSAGAQA